MTDAVVIGSGPNGLSAAIALAQEGARVVVLEKGATPGGGMRTEERTLPGFLHDLCSAAHPTGLLSPFFSTLPLADHGLRWRTGRASFAHPLDHEGRRADAALLFGDFEETLAQLGADQARYRKMVAPFVAHPRALLADALGPLGVPDHPLLLARFGLLGLRSARSLAGRFEDEATRALIAGCAAHSVLSLEHASTAAMALVFLVTAHTAVWPVAEGGSAAITRALVSYLESLGGRVETGVHVRSAADLPPARVYLFDTNPRQLASIAGDTLPARYRRRLGRYRYGPGVFKIDWALDGSIPWRDPRCRDASTVHVGGTFDEIARSEAAMWNGEHAERPFLLLCQQSELDPSRAPAGKQTGYAYCHVPAGSTVDMTEAIEAQVERFAPGFRDRILARHTMTTADMEAHNPNYVGGAITGGVSDVRQLFTRPVARLDPYRTPNRRVFICSSSSPPGGGVHGMCGYHAAQSALRELSRQRVRGLA